MLTWMIVIEAVLMLAAPVALAILLRRRWGASWALIGIGAATFILSQVVHVPLNVGLTALFRQDWMPKPPSAWQLPFNAIVLGLTAGVCEETARYLTYRFWARGARNWRQAIALGAGHGGIESAITGLLVAITLVNMIVLRDLGPGVLGLSDEQAAAIGQEVAAFWDTPLYLPWLAFAERLMAMLLHLSLSALVLQVFRGGRLWPWGAAILWHATVNAVAVYANQVQGALAAEGAVALLSLVSVAILWATHPADRTRAGRAAA